jgi:hypothetical protein
MSLVTLDSGRHLGDRGSRGLVFGAVFGGILLIIAVVLAGASGVWLFNYSALLDP